MWVRPMAATTIAFIFLHKCRWKLSSLGLQTCRRISNLLLRHGIYPSTSKTNCNVLRKLLTKGKWTETSEKERWRGESERVKKVSKICGRGGSLLMGDWWEKLTQATFSLFGNDKDGEDVQGERQSSKRKEDLAKGVCGSCLRWKSDGRKNENGREGAMIAAVFEPLFFCCCCIKEKRFFSFDFDLCFLQKYPINLSGKWKKRTREMSGALKTDARPLPNRKWRQISLAHQFWVPMPADQRPMSIRRQIRRRPCESLENNSTQSRWTNSK